MLASHGRLRSRPEWLAALPLAFGCLVEPVETPGAAGSASTASPLALEGGGAGRGTGEPALGVAGGSASSPAAAADDASRVDYDALARCSGVQSCPVATARRVDGSLPFDARGFDCVLSGLRDRVPGLYELRFDHDYAGGQEVRWHRFFVTVSGAVETGTHVDLSADDQRSTATFPTRRCQLLAPDVYDDCLSDWLAGDVVGAAPACLNVGERGGAWLSDCEDRTPSCE